MQEKILERIVAEVPVELKRRVTIQATLQGKSIKDVLIEALEKWLTEESDDAPELKKLTLAA